MYELGTLLAIWLAVYAVTVALYLGQGLVTVWVNDRNPDRRIQKERSGKERTRVEIIQSLKSLTVTCGCLAGGIWLQWMGWTLWPPLELSWWSVLLMGTVSLFLNDAWFYWGHRLLHWRPFYRHHYIHHRSVTPTAWSNYSETLVDAAVLQGYFLVAPILLPIPAAVLIAHRVWDHINGQMGHIGFEYFAGWTTRFPSPMICVTFHDQHHEQFNYNYSNTFSFWDRLCGTIHPDYDALVKSRPEKQQSMVVE